MNVNIKNIPDELKARDTWVLWKAESREGEDKDEKKPTKVRIRCAGGERG